MAMVAMASAQQPRPTPTASSKSERPQRVRAFGRRAERIVVGAGQGAGQAGVQQGLRSGSRAFHARPSTPIPGMQPLPPGAVSAADWVRVRREFPGASPVQQRPILVQRGFEEHGGDARAARARAEGPDAGFDRGQRFRGGFRGRDVVVEHAGFARQTRALWKIVGGAGAVFGRGGNPATDQSAYEPIFHAASSIMERYRDALGARKMVPQELARLGVGTSARSTTKTGAGSKKNRNRCSVEGRASRPSGRGGDARRSTSGLKRNLFFGIYLLALFFLWIYAML